MKSSILVLCGCLSVSSFLAGCNPNSKSASSSGGVLTSLTMTGSGQNAIAQSKFQKIFSLFIPSAVALTPPVLVDSTGINVGLSEAWVVVKDIKFKTNEVSDGVEDDSDEIKFRGPFFVDLLSNSPVSFGDAIVPEVGIRRIKMKLHEADSLPTSVPAQLSSKSIYFSGTVNGFNFSYAADDSTEFEIAGPNPILPSSSKEMLIVIRMADLFKKINLSSISSHTDIHAGNRVAHVGACPSIDPSANDLYTCFRKGLSVEGNFGNDDGDNDLDSHDETVD